MAGKPPSLPGPATQLPGSPRPVATAAVLPGTMKLAAPGSGSQGGGGGGGGGGSPTPLAPLITWPTLTPPSWYTGPPKNLNQLASLIRNAFFAGLGDLSGYPYNSLIVVGGTVNLTITSAGGTVPQGLVITAILFALDANGNSGQIVSTVTGPLTGGTATLALNATMNKTYQYRLQVSINAGNVASGASYATIQDTQTGLAWFNGIPESIQIPALASGGSVRVTVVGSDGNPVGAGGLFNYSLIDTTIEANLLAQGTEANPVIEQSQLAMGTATTDASGGFTIDLTGVDYVQADSMELDMTYTGGIKGAAVGFAKATFGGSNLAAGVVPVTYNLSTGGVASGAGNSITFHFTQNGSDYTGSVVAFVGEQDLSVGQGFTESVNAYGTGPEVMVGVPAAWESDTLYASWGAGLSGGTEQYGSNGPSIKLTVSAASIAAGTAKVTIEITTGTVTQVG